MKIPDISPQMFYTVGKYMFFIIALVNLIRVVDQWSILKSYDIFSILASAIFYFVLAWFFGSMGKKELVRELSDGDAKKIHEAIEQLNLGGK